MISGWQSIGGSWYYFADSGVMATGRVIVSGRMSSFADSGRWLGYVS